MAKEIIDTIPGLFREAEDALYLACSFAVDMARKVFSTVHPGSFLEPKRAKAIGRGKSDSASSCGLKPAL